MMWGKQLEAQPARGILQLPSRVSQAAPVEDSFGETQEAYE